MNRETQKGCEVHLIGSLQLVGAAMSVIILTSSSAVPFDDSKSEASSADEENDPVDIVTYTDFIPKGQVRSELSWAAERVADYLSAHEDVFAGGHITTDSSHYSISVAKPNDEAVEGIRKLIATLGSESQYFQFENVERSRDELQEIQMAIVYEFAVDPSPSANGLALRKDTSIQSIGIKDSPSKVTIEILDKAKGLPLEENPEVKAINERFPGAVMFKKVFTTVMGTSSNNDVAPHYGGTGTISGVP